jgi:hypothetical protein
MQTLTYLAPLVEAKSQATPVSCGVGHLRLRLGYDVASMHSNGYDSSIIQTHQALNDALERFLVHPLIGQYLGSLTPQEVYGASGVRVLPLEAIKDEIHQLAPGACIFPHGYLPFATSIGGNSVCFHVDSGRVVWAHHNSFLGDDEITFKDQATGDYHTISLTPENIEKAVVVLGGDIATFLADFLQDKLEGRLNELD